MKKLLLGNEAVARGLYEAGCGFVSSYPGTPSTEITEAAAKYDEIYAEWAPNEKVAMEAAFGASLSGTRSFCGMKHVGLNVAADPLFTLSYTGVNAGMIIAVADDAGMHSSQNEQDSRHYAIAAKLPMFEPSDSAEALEFTKLAYEISEKYDAPVLMKMCTRVAHSQSVVELNERTEIARKPYEKNVMKWVMMPGMAKKRHPIVEERTRRLVEFAEKEQFGSEETKAYLKERFAGLNTEKYGALVLGCTHFNYFKDMYKSFFPENTRIFDGNEGTIRQLARRLSLSPVNNDGDMMEHIEADDIVKRTEYYTSGRRVDNPEVLEHFRRLHVRLEDMRCLR